MKIVLFGAGGQVGQALQACAPKTAQITALTRDDADLADPKAVASALKGLTFDWLVNAAAYTAVDKAQSEPERARAVNAEAVAVMAQAARAAKARFAHISTDFVFDGQSSTPYKPGDVPNPLSVYGQTKWQGEIAAGGDALIVRTSWVYRAGHPNFVTTMLRLMESKPALSVVSDQIGTPTSADTLAPALWTLMAQGCEGVLHYSDSGVASWYDFAVAIQEEALAFGLLDQAIPILPIDTAHYPAPAKRPAYSVMDKTDTWAALGGPAPHWRSALRDMLKQVKNNG
jgi:dTDP-4-dehydrorhamnose reductase